MKRVYLGICLLVLAAGIASSGLSCGDFTEELSYQRARNFHDKGNYPEAISLYTAILSQDPQNTQVQYDLGVAYIETRNYDAAREQMQVLRKNSREDLAEVLSDLIDQKKSR